jgi:pimeloyl-ACP methyl ester carboxylesterase
MKRVVVTTTLTLCFLLAWAIGTSYAAELTKEEILALVAEFDDAYDAHDTARAVSLFTDDAVIDMVVIPPFDKEGERQFLDESWPTYPTIRHSADAFALASASDKVGITEHSVIYVWPDTGYPVSWFHLCVKDCVLTPEGPKIKQLTAYGDWAADTIQGGAMPRRNLGDMIPSFTLPAPEGTGLAPMEASAELITRLNSRDLPNVAKMIQEDASVRFPFIDRPSTRSELMDIYEQMLGGFSDAYWENTRRVDMGDGWVFSENTLKGTNDGEFISRPATGLPMNVRAGLVEHYDENGLATYVHFHFDTLSMPGQEAPTEGPPPTGMAPVNDIQMYYETHGEGQPLILLHGGLGNAGYWEKQIPVFAEKYKVIAVDSRGQGRSTYSEQPIGYSLMASDVIALMDYLGIEKADVVGWSDGGIIGLDLAINHPERLHKLIAFGANYNTSGVRADAFENEKANAYFAKASEDYQKLSPDPSRWDALLENLSSMWASEPNFTASQLGSITVPILVLDGENEEVVYAAHTKEMASLIPTAKLILIPGTGHFAPWEKPEEFNQIVLDYLAEIEDFSNVFFMSLSTGLNMISLPLKPQTSYNARSFAEMLSATVVIKLDEARQRFVGFTLDAPDDGFDIEGGKGYIVNVPEGKTIAFTGATWTNQPPVESAPTLDADSAWAFVVSGTLSSPDDRPNFDGYTIQARNLRTGVVQTSEVMSLRGAPVTKQPQTSEVLGYFAIASADLSRKSIIQTGDELEIIARDASGNIVSRIVRTIDADNIGKAYLNIPLRLGDIIPSQTVLLQNYPNPFNPETWIPFHLAQDADVSVRIYDAGGRLVRTLALGHREAGIYVAKGKAVYWDGKSDSGEKVASGVYFYSIKAGDFSATRKLMVRK